MPKSPQTAHESTSNGYIQLEQCLVFFLFPDLIGSF